MELFLKKIKEGKFDDELHGEFIKFSKGVFDNKYLIEAKKQKDKWSIKTGAEYANYLVKKCLMSLGDDEVDVKGVIVSTFDMKSSISFPIENVKQFMGIKQLVIGAKVRPASVIELMNKFPRAFYALSFSGKDFELKIKAKAPKSAKPAATGEKEPKAEFCSLKTSDSGIVKELFFDVGDFNEISIKHTLKINEITLPHGEKDPVQIREKAKRKGVIVRKIKVDGNESVKEYGFEA